MQTKIETIEFLYPQNGKAERHFKEKILPLLITNVGIKKAYLVSASYQSKKEKNTVLCLNSINVNEQEIIKNINEVFKNMFNNGEKLDIYFIKDLRNITKICPPFFNRNLSENISCDFYLKITEGLNSNITRECRCIKQLSFGERDDLVVVNISPSLTYQDPIDGNIELDQIALAGRHLGYPIYPLKHWPIYVYVVRLKNIFDTNLLELSKENIENIAWGELSPEK